MALVLPILLLLLILCMVVLRSRRSRMCRWRAQGGGLRHICAACGARMDTPGKKMPRFCVHDSYGKG